MALLGGVLSLSCPQPGPAFGFVLFGFPFTTIESKCPGGGRRVPAGHWPAPRDARLSTVKAMPPAPPPPLRLLRCLPGLGVPQGQHPALSLPLSVVRDRQALLGSTVTLCRPPEHPWIWGMELHCPGQSPLGGGWMGTMHLIDPQSPSLPAPSLGGLTIRISSRPRSSCSQSTCQGQTWRRTLHPASSTKAGEVLAKAHISRRGVPPCLPTRGT